MSRPRPRRRSVPVRRRAAALLAVLALVPLSACDGGGDADPSPTPTALSSLRDPLADLDRGRWEVVDAPSMMAIPVDEEGIDKAAWAAAGVDDARIRAARQALADYVTTAYMQPDALRETDDAADRKTIVDASPTDAWAEAMNTGWDEGNRQLYGTEFAPDYRVVGRPRAVVHWYLTEREDLRLVELGGTIAYTVLNTRTGDIGIFAQRVSAAVVPGVSDDTPIDRGDFQILLAGNDICATTDAGGLVVPAISDDEAAASAQSETRHRIIDKPDVSRTDIAAEEGGAMQFDMATVVPCPS